ncbi:MAG: alpha-glucosidase/alpha-galactosidase [Oscillospiraceae bacterium]|nr:alpha-glucosidase/alpha-galactosidase [Oscillospiraceae bacterium]
MSFKITFIGAGSIGFTRTLLCDILSVPEFKNCEVAFTDIDEMNLDMVTRLCQRDIDLNGLNIKIHSTLNRREALKNAKYIISCVRIGRLEGFETDINIPLKYGVDQCVGDTLCAGGIMYGQRGVNATLDFCKDIREVCCENALFLNYANPNSMLTWAANKYGGVNTVGLCHGVEGGHWLIADAFGLKREDVDIICAGINHQTWYVQITHNGEDLTGKLLEKLEAHPTYSKTEKVRIDMLRRFGYFSTESNGHLSEYVSWYRKRADEIADWIDLSSWINGETGGYLRVCTEGRSWFLDDYPNWLKADPKKYDGTQRSGEHGGRIIEGLETGRVYRGHFNVVNNGIISNLASDAIVEVPGYVDKNGVNIPVVGDLPLGCAAVCAQSINVQRLAVEAAVTADRTLLIQALMLDPLTGAVCNPFEIEQMADEMLVAGEQWLPQYKAEIALAKKRLENPKVKTREGYSGAARLHTKTVDEMRKTSAEATKNASEADKAKKE